MKKIRILSGIVLGLISSLFTLAEATPLYYTFESSGNFSSSTGGEPIEGPIEYIFRVDGPYTVTQTESSDSGYQRYFMDFGTTLISGTGLEISADQQAASFGGYAVHNPNSGFFQLSLGMYAHGANGSYVFFPEITSPDIPVEILTSYDAFTGWAVGHIGTIDNMLTLNNPDGVSGVDRYRANSIILTSITEYLPGTSTAPASVPEPESYLLLGLGLLVMQSIRRRKPA
jgi:hypothetical protein